MNRKYIMNQNYKLWIWNINWWWLLYTIIIRDDISIIQSIYNSITNDNSKINFSSTLSKGYSSSINNFLESNNWGDLLIKIIIK